MITSRGAQNRQVLSDLVIGVSSVRRELAAADATGSLFGRELHQHPPGRWHSGVWSVGCPSRTQHSTTRSTCTYLEARRIEVAGRPLVYDTFEPETRGPFRPIRISKFGLGKHIRFLKVGRLHRSLVAPH